MKHLTKKQKIEVILIIVAGIFLSLAIKSAFMNVISHDMKGALLPWTIQYSNMNVIECLKTPVGDYPIIYNYLLITIAHIFPSNGFVHAIKTISIIFDFLNASVIFLIIKKKLKNYFLCVFIFSISLILPTIIIDGSIWGQCNVIFTSLILLFIYFILEGKPRISMIFLSLAFCFKIQTVFILPLVLYFILKRRVKIHYLLYIPAIYLIVASPALMAGHPFKHIIMPWYNYPNINDFAPNLYSWMMLIESVNQNVVLGYVLIPFAFIICLLGVIYCYNKQIELTFDNVILLALASCLICPFVLPKMHERYFFLAEIIAFIYLIIKSDLSSLIIFLGISIASVGCSLNTLLGFMFGNPCIKIIPMVGTLFIVVSLVFIIREIIRIKPETTSKTEKLR